MDEQNQLTMDLGAQAVRSKGLNASGGNICQRQPHGYRRARLDACHADLASTTINVQALSHLEGALARRSEAPLVMCEKRLTVG